MGEHEPPHPAHEGSPPRGRLVDVRDPLPDELRDPSFPAAVRGYDRRAVDAYVERINGVIAELQVSGSPAAAVRHALDRVGEQTSGILQRARETAEEITSSAREEAEETTARAKAEARDITSAAERQAGEAIERASGEADTIVADARANADQILARASEQSDETLLQARLNAEAQTRRVQEEVAALRERAETELRALQADIAAVTDERGRVLDEVRRLSARLETVVAEVEPNAPVAEPGRTEAPGEEPFPMNDQ